MVTSSLAIRQVRLRRRHKPEASSGGWNIPVPSACLWLGYVVLLLLLIYLPYPARAADPTARPKTIVLLASSGLSYDALRPNGPLPDVRKLAEMGSVGLLNASVRGEATDAAAFLTIGAGEQMSAPATSGPRVYEVGISRTVADMAAEAYMVTDWGSEPSRETYRRRFGVDPPRSALMAEVGLPTLLSAQATPRIAAQAGALGEALTQSGKRVAAFGEWPAALVAMDRQGCVAGGWIGMPLLPSHFAAAVADADVIVISVRSFNDLKFLVRAALPYVERRDANVLIASIAPPRRDDGAKWERLGFLVAAGPDFPARTVLTSPTTRTPGLVANIDIAPTILALQGASTALVGGSGRAITCEPTSSTWNTLTVLDRQTIAVSKSFLTLMIAYCLFSLASAVFGILSLRFELRLIGQIAYWGLLISAGVFLTLLPIGYFAPQTITGYCLTVFLLAVSLAAFAFLIGHLADVSPLGVLLALVSFTVLIDTLTGSHLAQRAVDNFLPGIRYYGIGNEYLGIVLGSTLVAIGLLPSLLPRAAIYAIFGLLTLAIGLPELGANSGGALTATVAFTVLVLSLQGIPLRARHVLLAFGLGFAVTFALAALDFTHGSESRSHMGEAIAAGQSHGIGALTDIISRKLGMNFRIGTNPMTLIAIAGLVPLWGTVSKGALADRARQALSTRPGLVRVLPACGWAAIAALLFKDSGIVTALIILSCPTAALVSAMIENAAAGVVAT